MEFNTALEVQDYYGKVLNGSDDLKTSACCSTDSIPEHHKEILKQIHDDILTRFYGCGSPIPPVLKGRKVLDLGCGTGRDVYLLSKLVGKDGFVTGIDMTDEQLQVARKYLNWQMEKFGYGMPNVIFKKGFIEDLQSADVEDNSQDVVVSNCVINLSANKHKVFSEIFRVLKPGGELYFSDVFSDRRVPEELQKNKVMVGECLGGAMYIEDFRRMLRDLGCLDYRIVAKSKIELEHSELEGLAGMLNFYSLTIRAFKLGDDIEDICEDYGQTATYLGSIENMPHRFKLDDHHLFHAHKPMLVCGNTTAMLQKTRYREHFNLQGDRKIHFGPFDCGDSIDSTPQNDVSGSCC